MAQSDKCYLACTRKHYRNLDSFFSTSLSSELAGARTREWRALALNWEEGTKGNDLDACLLGHLQDLQGFKDGSRTIQNIGALSSGSCQNRLCTATMGRTGRTQENAQIKRPLGKSAPPMELTTLTGSSTKYMFASGGRKDENDHAEHPRTNTNELGTTALHPEWFRVVVVDDAGPNSIIPAQLEDGMNRSFEIFELNGGQRGWKLCLSDESWDGVSGSAQPK